MNYEELIDNDEEFIDIDELCRLHELSFLYKFLNKRIDNLSEKKQEIYKKIKSDFLNFPNKEYEFIYSGLHCFLKRPQYNWCGYVIVDKYHPCHNLIHDNIEIEVHGGLTFGFSDNSETTFGFDTSHLGDIYINLNDENKPILLLSNDATYKDYEFVVAETKLLAEKLSSGDYIINK
jgi:hypothetical protein